MRCFLLRLSNTATPAAMSPRAATPPTTPPAIAPTFVGFRGEEVSTAGTVGEEIAEDVDDGIAG